MRILRFGEAEGNSSLRAIRRRVEASDLLSSDLRGILKDRRLPVIDPLETPIIEQWVIENYPAAMLTGYIHYPNKPDPWASEWLSFTAPLELLSVEANLARSMARWYRLGTPSPWAKDTLAAWSHR
ncbi:MULTISPECIES: hypothetical protein [Rhizobium]|uniref:hypothetical protein n=1 Tax=Rhizobium TaxID=379 RepID=UPI0004883D14|nr:MULTISPECIES: hypothetical protein [Rhizobium]WFT86005.1 hypothetical protein QA638_24505 [Rhizobium leguminosarum]